MPKIKTGFVTFLVFLITLPVFALKFYPDDPIQKDNDQKPSPEPIHVNASYVNDLIKNTRYKDKNPNYGSGVSELHPKILFHRRFE